MDEQRVAPGRDVLTVRLVLVDDHELLLDSLCQTLGAESDFVVVGSALTLEAGLATAARTEPDIVVLDLRLDDNDAVSSISHFAALPSRPKVVILSAAHDRRSATRALEAGAAGYLTKQQPLVELLAGLRGIARGRTVLDPSLLGGVLREYSDKDPTRPTAREHEVLLLLAQGFDAARIGEQLNIATNTVRNHIQRILTKLGATNRLEAVARARAAGILDE